jgi:NCS1 family nucleobase:cation symporter-1
MQPWHLLARAEYYIDRWLVGYSSLLGAVGGVLIADYYLLRGTRLDLAGLYRKDGPYWYADGFNPVALAALAAGIAPCVPGFLAAVGWAEVPGFWTELYRHAWFVSFAVSLAVYELLSTMTRRPKTP